MAAAAELVGYERIDRQHTDSTRRGSIEYPSRVEADPGWRGAVVRKRPQLPAYSSTLAEYREAAARPGGDAYRFWIPPSTAIKPRHRDELRPVHVGDWAWFREHPHRHFRIRYADLAEGGSHVVVKQARLWALVRISVTVGARDNDKSLARLFDTDCPEATRGAKAALDDGRAE